MKKLLIPMILMALLAALAGCASKTDGMDAAGTGTPMTSPDVEWDDQGEALPGATGGLPETMPDTLPGTGTGRTTNTMTGLTTASRARKAIGEIEAELMRLSEVRDAKVVAAGNTAVVALDFDSQYQAGVNKRMEDMVRDRIKSVSGGIENVIVTDDRTVRDTLASLGDRLDGEADMTGLESELQKIIREMKNMA